MIRNILLDIVGVLTNSHGADYFEARGVSPEMSRSLAEAIMGSPYWEELDIGLMSEAWILRRMCEQNPQWEQEIRESFENPGWNVTRRAGTKDWIERLRGRGYRVLVFSNFSLCALRNRQEALDFLGSNLGGSGVPGERGVISEGIISCRDHVVKPYPEIYALVLSRYSLAPEETAFIDDTPKNLLTAKRYGIRTILFTSRAQAERELLEES